MSSEDLEQLLESQNLILTVFNARIKYEQDETIKQLAELEEELDEELEARTKAKGRYFDAEHFEQTLYSIKKKCVICKI
jgi:hypothetical protein